MLTHSAKQASTPIGTSWAPEAMQPLVQTSASFPMTRYWGNSALQQSGLAISSAPVLQRKCACGGTPDASGECAECRRKRLAASGHHVQTKLKVGPAHDQYEQEADRIADTVVGTAFRGGLLASEQEDIPVGGVSRPAYIPRIQRRIVGQQPGDSPVSESVHTAINSLQGRGHPLTPGVRSLFEQQMGYDFSRVRIHTDAHADRTSDALGAHAFTVGNNIAFRRGMYEPQTNGGQKLLAHELTHVVQQGATGVARGNLGANPLIQRDLARPLPNPGAVATVLTPAEIQDAIQFNKLRYEDPYTIRVVRDVIGIAPTPAVIDETFVQAIVQWQAENNLTQDGKVGPATTRTLVQELGAEGQRADARQLRLDNFVRVNTVNGPVFNDCSALPRFRWDVAFRTSLRNGFIIQRIDNVWNYLAGPPTPAPTLPRYWEAWTVDGAGNVTPTAGALNDRWQRFFPAGSRGNWSMTGRLFTVLSLPAAAGFGVGNVPDAGILQSTTTAPNPDVLGLPEGFTSIEVDEPPRRIGGTWDCTDANPVNWFHRRTI